MARIGTKDFRCQIDARLVDALDALAAARSAIAGKKIDRAEIVEEAFEAYLNVVPRLQMLGDVADLMARIEKLDSKVSDQIERGFAALAENADLRAEVETLNAADAYSVASVDFE